MWRSCNSRNIGRLIVLAGALLISSVTASASVIYQVTVDTSTFSGTGFINFQFNNPGDADPATAELSGFTTDGGALLGPPAVSPSVTGELPGTVTFANSVGLVDYFQEFAFGDSFQLFLTLDGDAIDAPSGTALSETVFLVYLYGSDGQTVLGPTDPDFNATGVVTIMLDGTVTTLAAGPNPIISFEQVDSVIPEPSTWVLSAGALLALAGIPRLRTALGRARS